MTGLEFDPHASIWVADLPPAEGSRPAPAHRVTVIAVLTMIHDRHPLAVVVVYGQEFLARLADLRPPA